MSEKVKNEIDLETVKELINEDSVKSIGEPDLDKMLPKLSKRRSQSSPSFKSADGADQISNTYESTNVDTVVDGSAVEIFDHESHVIEKKQGTEQHPPAPEPHVSSSPRLSRSSVTSIPNAAGGVTVMVRTSAGLAPELEKLRTQDIEPDANSAAFLALTSTKHNATLETDENGTAPKRRLSMTRQISGKYQRSSTRKVEGREIQQDHSQYALTYGLMLGIRVMTGRRDLQMDRRESLVRDKSQLQKTRQQSETASTNRPAPSPVPTTEQEAEPGTPRLRPISSKHSWDTEGALQMLEERALTIQDFEDDLELKFKPQGNTLPPVPTPPHKLGFSFKFKDYMPAVFRAVRAVSNIDEADYMLSLAGDFNYIEFIANSKSGQFFFYSHDGCYMIKTQSKEECVLLRQIMPQYVEHLTKHPNSLLVRFYGMHRVKFQTKKIYFVIMSSVFNTEKHIDIKYDLKGSLAGRLTSPKACKQGAVQKDLNLLESGRKIRLGEENIDLFYETLKADVNLLASLNIMDYSLLIGIHDKKATATGTQRRASGVVLTQQQKAALASGSTTTEALQEGVSPDCYDAAEVGTVFQSYYGGLPSARGVDEIYFMGIIDILQKYNLNKQTETFYKGLFSDKMLQSSIRPDLYASRMLDFIMKHTDYPEITAQRRTDAATKEKEELLRAVEDRRDML